MDLICYEILFSVWLLFVLLAPKYPGVTNNTSTSKLKRNVASFSSIYAMSICLLKPACFFFFGLVWCVLLFIWRVGWMVFFVYSYVGSLVFFLSFYNRHIHVNTKHVKSKQDAKVPRRSQEKKSQQSIVC